MTVLPHRDRARPTMAATWLILAVVALALRLPDIGNPLIDLDEQFYLLVGDRMLHGAVPYVDIWDRKPVGLFLIYAAARVVGVEHWLNNNNNNDHFHFDYDAPHFDGGTVSRGRYSHSDIA